MEHWFYFSFADPTRPKGTQFLGGCYVQVPSDAEGLPEKDMLWETVCKSHRLGINPGGEIRVVGPVSAASIEKSVLAEDRERLLTREEIEANNERLAQRTGERDGISTNRPAH